MTFCDAEVDHYMARTSGFYQYQFKKTYPKRDPEAFAGLLAMDFDWELEPPIKLRWRLMARLKMLQRGNDPEYGYAYLCYLHAIASRDNPELANVYAEMALDMLVYGCQKHFPFAENDLLQIAPPRLPDANWMNRRNRKGWSSYWASHKS
ncbi:MAG: hypothetical protein JNK19_12020 [Tabrizicola sp.]|nr:hypothetical protein [Tabrizicola sp.]